MKTILAILLFFIFVAMGIGIAAHKYLWLDEVYSQNGAISHSSYQQIIFSGIEGEGNKSPLFYLQQKIFCDLFLKKNYQIQDRLYERIFLRIPTVVEISLFLSMLFYFFTRRFNLWFGFLSIFVALSSLMLWWYWAEARPYGLWVFLTACQMFLFIDILEDPVGSRKRWVLMYVTQAFLAMTCVLSLIQITVIAAILLFKWRHWEKLVFLLLVPVALVFYYKPPGAGDDAIFIMTVDQVMRDNIARDRLYVLLFYPMVVLLYFIGKKFRLKINDVAVKSFFFFLAVFSMIGMTFVFLTILRAHALNKGYYVVSRHIIFLLPVGIIAVSYLAGIIWESLKSIKWVGNLLVAGILLTMLYRVGRIMMGIKAYFLGFH